MLVDNPDAFKSWLIAVLEPLCDADPEALAKYVFALVKKDKSVDALRQRMTDQLDVFLQAETKPFVDLLFKTLETQDFDLPSIPNANPPNPNVPVAPPVTKKEAGASPAVTGVAPASAGAGVADMAVKEIKLIIPPSSLPNLSESINGSLKKDETAVTASAAVAAAVVGRRDRDRDRDRDHRKSDSEKEERARPGGRGRHRSSSRNRSRSRSWDKGKRSRSRDKERALDRERRDRSRPWRNKSPPRKYDRRRSRSGSAGGTRARSRSRSPRHSYRGRYRNRSPPRSASRSRSRSAGDTRDAKKEPRPEPVQPQPQPPKEEASGAATPTQDSNHGDTDMRLTSTTQSIQSVVSALAAAPTGDAPAAAAPSSAFGGAKRRCRDFDEKGYCMRGETCPYDHGVDPVILEDTALTRVLTFAPMGPNGAAPPDGPPGQAGLLPPPVMAAAPALHPHLSARPVHPEYNPSAPAMWHRPGFRGLRPMLGPRMPQSGPFGPLPSMQRELISVPVTDNTDKFQPFKRKADTHHHHHQHQHQQQQQQHGPHEAAAAGGQPGPPPSKKGKGGGGGGGFDFTRLGPRAKHPGNCSLELKKVPRGLNNITHLNNHFFKFGKITNIQVCYEGDPEAALITFSSHAEANAAYRSTEAVLNNRFIKVFWHSAAAAAAAAAAAGDHHHHQQQQQQPPQHLQHLQHHRPMKERLGQAPVAASAAANANKVLNLVQARAQPEEPAEAAHEPAADDADRPQPAKNVYVPSAVAAAAAAAKDAAQAGAETRALANAAIVKSQELLAAKEQLKKKHEEKKKEAFKITQNLRKRKQELLEKQLAQQKLLIDKLEKTNPTGQQRDLLMTTIKTVQESIESIQRDIRAASAAGAAAGGAVSTGATLGPSTPVRTTPHRKSKEEAQKEVLDAELDLITKQQEGVDTSELQRRLLELKAQAFGLTGRRARGGRRGGARYAAGLSRAAHHLLLTKNNVSPATVTTAADGSAPARGGSARGAARGPRGGGATAGFLKHTVDHRPTKLLVSGYEADESKSVLAHFAQFGEITEYVTDETTPSIVLIYKSRKEAEMAMLRGKQFQDRKLSVTWCNSAQLSSQRACARSTSYTAAAAAGQPELATEPEPQPRPRSEDETAASASPFYSAALSPLYPSEPGLLDPDSEELRPELSEDALLQDDEEDDDENEDRSWRR